MRQEKWNESWKFWVEKDAFSLVWNIPPEAVTVTVPHDAMLLCDAGADSQNGGNTGFRDGKVYDYVKMLYVPTEARSQTWMLRFDGVYMNAFVYVNGQLAAKCPFGYSQFYVNLNDYISYGQENEIRVIAKNGAMPNSRWYSGGGIYRDVYLLKAGLAYIVPQSVQITTECIEHDYSTLRIETEIKNRTYQTGCFSLVTSIETEDGTVVASERVPVDLLEGEQRIVSQRMIVEEPQCWSDTNPVLYHCVTRLFEDGTEIDRNRETFGIRTLSLDAKQGLRVNKTPVKLRGACIHHDSGLLGAATYMDAQYRQIRILKDAGFNAVRMAHNPMAPAMLQACDELGMYVMDECFDMWNRSKSDYDYSLYFEEWWEKDVTSMVRKDFNHPCVLMYSVGNEIPEIGLPHGEKLCHEMNRKIKELDFTRYTLASVNGIFSSSDKVEQIMSDVVANMGEDTDVEGNVNDFMTLLDGHLDEIVVHPIISERIEKACAATDIAGYNYMTARYIPDGAAYPNRVIVGSETYPPEIARNWELVKKLNYLIGDFTWTGWDYIGEAGVGVPAYRFGEGGFGAGFPCQLAYAGDIDLTGWRRPASYYREIVFGLRTDPYITVQNPHHYGEMLIKTPWVISDSVSSWSWEVPEGSPVVVEVYSPGDEVELICNGTSLGKKSVGGQMKYRTLFDTVYEKGTLTAIAYENGVEVGRFSIDSAGFAEQIVAEPEDSRADELVYIPVSICDAEGNRITDRAYTLEAVVSGGRSIAGFGSGSPKPNYNYTGAVTETFEGRALLILKKENDTDARVTIRTLHCDRNMSVEIVC